MSRYFQAIAKYEVYFFYAITIATLLPIVLFESFPTVDGPAHLYNSRLIHELLSENTGFLSTYFEFNKGFIPNWLGHFVLSSLMFLFPALIAEKILLSIYIILLPISFRFLWKQVSIDDEINSFALYFVFPFSYSFLFYFGFYNFHLGIVLLFFTLGLWIKYSKSKAIKPKYLVLLILLTLLIYFSHLFVLAVFVGVVAYITMIDFFKSSKVDFIKSLKTRILLVAPGCILSCIYLINHHINPISFTNPISLYDAWSMIKSVEPARAIEYGKEGVFTKWIFILFIVILSNLVIVRIKNFKASLSQNSIIWGGISIGLLIGFFIIPNGSTFNKSRILVFLFLMFILFISTQKINVWVRVSTFILINYVNIALLNIYIESTGKANKITSEILEASNYIDPYSTVLPIDESGYWLLSHSSNYLGINKPLVILENYEATTNYFPLKWNYSKLPYLHVGDSMQELVHFPSNINNPKTQIDFIFIMSDVSNPQIKGQKEIELKSQLEKYYKLIFTSDKGTIKVYKKALDKS